jgi:Na+-transporting NADH:ubiquinone oxidoreductase subunit NqrD
MTYGLYPLLMSALLLSSTFTAHSIPAAVVFSLGMSLNAGVTGLLISLFHRWIPDASLRAILLLGTTAFPVATLASL